ncbi:MAG: glycosyltransferase family 4 protein [Janthinobacterium lividum]
MRLLLTTDTVGGVWTFTKELASQLLASGCEVLLLSLGRLPSSEQVAAVEQLSAQGLFQFVASEAPLEWMPANTEAYAAAESVLLELCCEFQPDVLLLSQFCFGALPVAAAKIVIAHSDVLGWASAVGKAPLAEDLWLRTYRSLVRTGLNGAGAVVAPTRAMLDSLAANFNLPERAYVIPNGRSRPSNEHSVERQLQAVTAGRMWDPAKNLAILTQIYPSMPVLVAGENRASKHGVEHLILLGQTAEADLMRLFHESSVYICASVYEPFGLAPLEAALCGCAILANDIPSLREVWGDAALYFQDAQSLSDRLQMFAADPAFLAEARQHSYGRALHFTVQRMADSYLRLIASLTTDATRSEARAA